MGLFFRKRGNSADRKKKCGRMGGMKAIFSGLCGVVGGGRFSWDGEVGGMGCGLTKLEGFSWCRTGEAIVVDTE